MGIGSNDLDRKMKQAQGFLKDRKQVRITVRLRGRQQNRPQSGVELLTKLHEDYFQDYGKLAKVPTVHNLSLTYNPVSK